MSARWTTRIGGFDEPASTLAEAEARVEAAAPFTTPITWHSKGEVRAEKFGEDREEIWAGQNDETGKLYFIGTIYRDQVVSDNSLRMKKRWKKIKAGLLPKPQRKSKAEVRRATQEPLDGSFGKDKGKRLVVTLHPDGRLDLRPERTRRTVTVVLCDVYRFAVRAQAEKARRERAAKRKASKLARLETA